MKKKEILIISDVSDRNGIGIEVYQNGELICEIFRDDSARTREITIYNKSAPFDLVEDAMVAFRKEGLWEFIE